LVALIGVLVFFFSSVLYAVWGWIFGSDIFSILTFAVAFLSSIILISTYLIVKEINELKKSKD
jgi:asparagine N-glycosylation enzyme membrane subunit Stt3